MYPKDKGIYTEISNKVFNVQSEHDVFAIWEEIYDEKTSLTPFFRKELRNILENESLQKFGTPLNEIKMKFA
jgi:hypothetical protein